MRRSIVSFIAGFLLAVGVSVAYAEVESFIGKQVDGQFPLIVDGEISEIPAITIEGRSYIPLRAAGELFGARVSWIDGEIIMEKNQAERSSETAMTPEEYAELARIEQEEFDRQTRQKNEISQQISKLRGEIQTHQFKIDALRRDIDGREEGQKLMPEYIAPNVPYEGSDLQRQHQEMLAQLRQELADLEAQLAELEQQKAELEAELQKHEAAQ